MQLCAALQGSPECLSRPIIRVRFSEPDMVRPPVWVVDVRCVRLRHSPLIPHLQRQKSQTNNFLHGLPTGFPKNARLGVCILANTTTEGLASSSTRPCVMSKRQCWASIVPPAGAAQPKQVSQRKR